MTGPGALLFKASAVQASTGRPGNSEPFPSAFTTLAFNQSGRRWFGTCSCKPAPRDLPSSVEQLRTSSAIRLFAVLVAHYNRETGKTRIRLGKALVRRHRG